jgi:hypothetical protein
MSLSLVRALNGMSREDSNDPQKDWTFNSLASTYDAEFLQGSSNSQSPRIKDQLNEVVFQLTEIKSRAINIK